MVSSGVKILLRTSVTPYILYNLYFLVGLLGLAQVYIINHSHNYTPTVLFMIFAEVFCVARGILFHIHVSQFGPVVWAAIANSGICTLFLLVILFYHGE